MVLAKRYWSDGFERFAKKTSERVGPKNYFHPLGDGRYAAAPPARGEADQATPKVKRAGECRGLRTPLGAARQPVRGSRL